MLARFSVVDDPRAANVRHELSEIKFIAVAAPLAGTTTCVEMAEFVAAKEVQLLGAAGLLDGYNATSYWGARDILKDFGAEPVDARVVVDRNRIT